MMNIVGITGTLGAGKGTIVEYLKTKGYIHLSVREYLISELQKRNLEINRDNLRELANNIRAQHGGGYIVQELYIQALESNQNCIIESIRCVSEIQALRTIAQENNGVFTLLAVDADPEKRYERSVSRGSQTDHITYKKFLDNEQLESQSEDPNKQNLPKCMEMADIVFENNKTIEELHQQVEEYFLKLSNNEIVQIN